MWTEIDLQIDVEKELTWEPAVHPKQIGVTVKNGVVHLAGHVDTFSERCAAERAAWRVLHVKNVHNEIRVDLPPDALRADDDIALAAMGNLEWNCLIPDTIEVEVVDAWITIRGQVDWQHQKDEAERSLCTLKGIKGIRNTVAIRPSASMGDVRAAIDEALKRNALVDASHIKAHVSHGVVALRGTARSRAEYEQAMNAAWAAPGVTQVEDHITIGRD